MGLFQQPDNSWEVALQCPQCGAPVTLEEADRIFSCAYCRVRLLMIHPGYPQYYLDPYLENEGRTVPELFYIPYWRIRGMSFSCLQPLKKERVVDVTFLAARATGLPPYLGLQSRAFKLRFLSSAKKGRFLQPQFPLEGFLSEITEGDDAPSDSQDFEIPKLIQRAFIGETISLVYAPFFIQSGTLFDGLGDLKLGRVSGSDFESIPTLGPEGFRQVRFLPVICPFCGADLQGEKDTQVLLCRNCDRVWDYSRDELKQIDFKILKDSGEKTQTFYLPFWRIRAKISGWPGQMPPPLSRPLLDSEQSPEGESEEGNLYWLPAFKLSPSLFLTASRAASYRQPLAPIYLDTLPQGQYYPVTLPWDQAAEGLNAVIADFIKTRPVSRLSPIKIEASDYLLIYIPFHTQGNELVHQGMSVGISQNALHFGRFL
jgi:DNA-directed RNA polymerase subunit RPC12/RpoP